MTSMPSPLQTLLRYQPVPSWPEHDDFFLFSDFNNGDSITEAEPLPPMEQSDEVLWIEELWNHSVPLSLEETNPLSTCSDYDTSAISSDDLSSNSGSVHSESDFSSFSPPLSPTISFSSQFQPMEQSDEVLWLEELWNHSVPPSLEETNPLSTCSDYDTSAISSDDLRSNSGSVHSESDFSSFSPPLSPTISFSSQFQPDSSFSPLCTTSTNTHATLQKDARKRSRKEEEEEEEEEEAVMFIVKGDGDALYDGYMWRKYGEKSIKHRAYRRSYYRCGHDGCKVRKQAEQSTENPLEFHITYYGRHNHSAITDFSSIGYN